MSDAVEHVLDPCQGLPQAGQDWCAEGCRGPWRWLPDLGLWVAQFPVTNREYLQYRPQHHSGAFRGQPLDLPEQPVVMVSFHEAQAYADWLVQRLRQAGNLGPEHSLRLPSHLEWAAYARCGDGREFPWGDTWPPSAGNYADASAQRAFGDWEVIAGYDDGAAVSCPVAEAGSNPWGLHGVGGNVYEWTFEAGGNNTELRGGSWSTGQREYLRISNRLRREPSSRLCNFGFRLVLTRLLD